MTLKELEKMKTAETIKLDAMIAIRKLLDEAQRAYKAAGGEDDWEDVEAEIKEKVFE